MTINIRKQTYEWENQIPASTPVNAPETILISTIGGHLTNVYFATDDPNAAGKVYFRITNGGNTIIPGMSAAPINTSMPAGWCSAPARVIHDVSIPLVDTDLTIEMVNYHTSAVNVLLQFSVSQETLETLLTKLINILKDTDID